MKLRGMRRMYEAYTLAPIPLFQPTPGSEFSSGLTLRGDRTLLQA